jgi:hypothetical protein
VTLRLLNAADAPAYQALRLRGLRESPSAFGSAYEEEADRPMDEIAAPLALGAEGNDVVTGVQPDAYCDAGRSWDSELMTMAIGEAP